MTGRRLVPALYLQIFLLVACAGDREARAQTIVGAWWRLLPTAVGPPPMEVFDVRPDGSFVTFAPAYRQDRGRYQLRPGILSVQSELNPVLRGDLGYTLKDADHLTLVVGPPLNEHQEWTRVGWPAHFELAEVGGRSLPSGIDRLIERKVLAAREQWRPDAVPVRLELEAMKNLELEATLDLTSPSTGAGLRLFVTRFQVKVVPYQVPPGPVVALPAEFLDLSRAVEAALRLGYDGSVKRARLTLGPEGPTWGFQFAGGSGKAGLVLNAVTGERVTHDMSVVMADYNRQWDEAIAGLRRLAQSAAPNAGGDDCDGINMVRTSEGMCLELDEFSCLGRGSSWNTGFCVE